MKHAKLVCTYTGHDFGSNHKDSICVSGKLFDMDSEYAPGKFRIGGVIPCPNCKPSEYAKWRGIASPPTATDS